MLIEAGLSATDQIKFIKASVNCYQPLWSELYKQFDPLQHSIYDTTKYPAQLNQYNVDDFKRVGLGMQKLAVNRISQNLFSQPVKRVYTYDSENQQLKDAVKIFETVSKNYLNIDSINIERAKSLFSACEVCSIIYVTDEPMVIGEYISPKKINIKLDMKNKSGYEYIIDGGGIDETKKAYIKVFFDLPKKDISIEERTKLANIIREIYGNSATTFNPSAI
jgi:hypothetical protein